MIRAVSYVRMSTRQQDASPEQQRKAIPNWRKITVTRLLREYADLKQSGMETENRPQLLQMLKDAADGQFDKRTGVGSGPAGPSGPAGRRGYSKPATESRGPAGHGCTRTVVDLTTLAGRLQQRLCPKVRNNTSWT